MPEAVDGHEIDRSWLARARRRLFWVDPPSWFVWNWYVRLHGVQTGVALRVYGRPEIRRFPGSLITLGDRVMLNSSRRAYPLPMWAAVRLATFAPSASIRIGSRVGINGSALVARSKTIEIGDDTIIAGGCVILDSDWHHLYAANRWGKPGSAKDVVDAPVCIEENVWIGFGSVILKGVRIGKNSVIGARSVVTKDIPPDSIAGGVPARRIGAVPISPPPE